MHALIHALPKEVAREMLAGYMTFGGMFLLGMLLMVVFPIRMNGCGGKILVPWFMVVIPYLALREAKDLNTFVLQPHWHLDPGLWSGLRMAGAFALTVIVNSAIFLGWGTLIEKMEKVVQNRAKTRVQT